MMRRFVFFVVFFALLAGCATKTVDPRQELFIYPQPPEEPKVVYLTSFWGEASLKKQSFFDILFGASPVQGLGKPYGLYASGDKLYISCSESGYVAAVDFAEKKMTYIGDKGAGKLAYPIGLAGTNEGMIFVSDISLKKVFGYDTKGDLKVAIGQKGELENPTGLAVNDQAGRLYVCDTHAHKVKVYSLKGSFLFDFGQRGAADGQFNFPTNLSIDRKTGNVFVVDTQNFRVQVFDKDGKFLSKFGELGDTAGMFSRPKGIGIDSEGHAYVVDAAFNNFQIFDEKGQILLFIGQSGNGPARFFLPSGLYVDESDRVYVADSLNNRVQIFQYLSEKWKKEHPEEYKKYQPQ